MTNTPISHSESHISSSVSRLNRLRASVLGANDGIISVASIVLGVAGATDTKNTILIGGVAGLVAGALSMAAGEYVSVSSQRDSERASLEKERFELENYPEEELAELAELYEKKGLSSATASAVAVELTANDAFAAHADAELRINPHDLTNPWEAAIASAVSFVIGGVIPLIAIIFSAGTSRIPITFAGAIIALFITGILSGKSSGAPIANATIRVVAGGAIAMIVTFVIGVLFGGFGI
jgi:VIT1/CCC1 family predicted Fe2+/Mn2+ transporter